MRLKSHTKSSLRTFDVWSVATSCSSLQFEIPTTFFGILQDKRLARYNYILGQRDTLVKETFLNQDLSIFKTWIWEAFRMLWDDLWAHHANMINIKASDLKSEPELEIIIAPFQTSRNGIFTKATKLRYQTANQLMRPNEMLPLCQTEIIQLLLNSFQLAATFIIII